jgi:exo-1,4-beta-D-glucosaminidase
MNGRMLAVLALSASALMGGAIQPKIGTQTLRQGWAIQAADRAGQGGELSRPGAATQGWLPTEVPATVMAALVRNGVHKDPFFGQNLAAIPPEPFKQGWWYRTEFTVDDPGDGSHTRLRFDGLNFRADVWLNGQKIAGRDAVFGAFRTYDLDITSHLLKGANALAVEVFPSQPGDFTMGFVDWNPSAPDHNMGLFREVSLHRTGPVALEEVVVRSSLNLKTLKEASLEIHAELINREDQPQAGILKGVLGAISFQVPYALKPGERKSLRLEPGDVPALRIRNPRLWWPHNLGKPELYTLELSALGGSRVSDARTVTFGIRQVSDYVSEQGHRGYIVNGQKVLIRGAGWVDDLFLREDAKNLEAQFRYVKHLNLNTVRLEGFWGSSQRLYDLADREGILLMVGWSCQWEWPEYLGKPIVESESFGGPKEPQDVELVTACLRDQVRWLRHHPSLFVWVVGSDKLPWPEVEKRYAADLKILDPTRPILTSCKAITSPVSGPSAVKMAGPYDYVTPNYWWEDTQNGGAFGFNTETGPGPQVPPLSALKRMLPPDKLWPINEAWNFHCGRFQFGNLDIYLKAFNARYGEARNVEEFAFRAQMANYEAMRPMFEAFGARRPATTGVVQWMLNGAWPKFFWQLYDTDLMPNGAFYGARKGNQPLSAVYDYGSRAVYLVNDTLQGRKAVTVRARTFRADSSLVLDRTITVACPANRSRKVLELPDPSAIGPVSFLDLRVLDAEGRELANNFYWLSAKPDVLDEAKTTWYATPNRAFADFRALGTLPPAAMKVEARRISGPDWEEAITLTNDSDRIAFGLELTVVGNSGEPLLPVLWEDNYVSLLPRERRTLRVRLPGVDLHGETPRITLKGWNLPLQP